MAYLNDLVLDLGLNVLDTEANRLDITSAEATDYTEATDTFTLGNKTSLSVGSPGARTPDGREVVVAAISDGDVTATGTATHWAIVDTANNRLLAAGSLSSSQAVTEGNPFSLSAFAIGIPGVA